MVRHMKVTGMLGSTDGELLDPQDFIVTAINDEDGRSISIYHEQLDLLFSVPYEPIDMILGDVLQGKV